MRPALLVLALTAFGALAVASVLLFILYDDDAVTTADAVVVLAGSRFRLPVGLELVERGVAPVLVISDGLDPRSPRANSLCRERAQVLCPKPDPYSTRGEARLIARLAAERGWDSIVVVSSRFHLFRARILIERCYRGRLAFVGAPTQWWRWPVAIGSEWMKLAVAGVERDC
ncbi:MAG: YdcF family protein [Gaiellaceae bacterium MAG52_C11]|nr:YdcF family protein [Candidatus Gaiellasilicea maunaloa]